MIQNWSLSVYASLYNKDSSNFGAVFFAIFLNCPYIWKTNFHIVQRTGGGRWPFFLCPWLRENSALLPVHYFSDFLGSCGISV